MNGSPLPYNSWYVLLTHAKNPSSPKGSQHYCSVPMVTTISTSLWKAAALSPGAQSGPRWREGPNVPICYHGLFPHTSLDDLTCSDSRRVRTQLLAPRLRQVSKLLTSVMHLWAGSWSLSASQWNLSKRCLNHHFISLEARLTNGWFQSLCCLDRCGNRVFSSKIGLGALKITSHILQNVWITLFKDLLFLEKQFINRDIIGLKCKMLHEFLS